VQTRSTCPYCGVGCGVVIEHDATSITGVRGDPDHPANRGQLCTKGRTLHLTATPAAMTARAREPRVRDAKGAPFVRREWDATLDLLADRFAACIREHGPDSVAFYVSGQLLTEDYYVFNKLAKGLIGTNNIDTNSRLCMSSAVAGYKMTLGADAPPTCYDDIDDARCLFIAGSNTAWAHPILYRRIEGAKTRDPSRRIVVVDPRRTATAASADLHLAIEPGTDVALFHGMLHLLLWDERVDRAFVDAHTSGFDDLKRVVREFTPRATAEICGIAEADLVQAARWFAEGPTLSLYCQGLNQSSAGAAKNAALINLHLATGQIGRPGAGPFSLTGQPNAMGGREVGGMANLLSGHRDLANAKHRDEIARLWGVQSVPANPGLTAVEMFDALADGNVRMIWIACTNPAQSMPDQRTVRAGLSRAELVVLQEAHFNTESAAYADVLLPASAWGEKNGTVTNSERCISRVRAAVAPPGEARADWEIAADFARRLEVRVRPSAPTLFPWRDASEIFDEHVSTTRGRDLDITGLDYARLDAQGPQQWPCREGDVRGAARLYTDGVFAHDDGRARFAAVPHVPVAEKVDARFPFRLTTGRLRDQWHGMSRTGLVATLYAHAPEPALELHPADIARRGFSDGDLVRVESRRGSVVIPLTASTDLRPGGAYLPMHWGSATLAGRGSAGINAVTAKAFCPVAKQPELKHAAIRVVRAELPWRLVAFGVPQDPTAAIALRDAVRERAGDFDYASVVLIGGERPGVLLRAAASSAVDPALLADVDALFGLQGADVARYDDRKRGIGRRVRVAAAKLAAVRLSGDVNGEAWLREWLIAARDVAALGPLLLVPSAQAPGGRALRGRIVCNCFDVAEAEISARLEMLDGPPSRALASLQAELKCGTNCGSCLPELKRMAAARPLEPQRQAVAG
jgi:assimilatory nitrate reductase catalytic subunit